MTKVLMIFISILITGSVIVFWLKNKGDSEIYLIPENYEGEIVVFFNVKYGVPEKYEGESRTYDIPNDGILRTQFKFNKGLIPKDDIKFYYKSSKDQRIELPYSDKIPYEKDPKIEENQTVVFSKRYGTGITNETNENTTYTSLLVGKAKDADSLFNRREKIHTPDLILKH